MSSSILNSIEYPVPGRCIPPWKWGDIQIGAFQCDFRSSDPANLPLSNHDKSEFKISQEAFEWGEIPYGYRQPCDLVSDAILPAITACEKDITTDQFAYRDPLWLRFCGTMIPVPGNVVVSTRGVPAVGYNTSEDFRQIWQKPDRNSRPGRELSDEAVRAMNMTIIIALAQSQARAVELGCIESREVFEVATAYVPAKAKAIDIYTAKVTRAYLTDLMDPETPFNNALAITKTVICCADPEGAVTTVLRFMMASVSKIKVLKEMHNLGLAKQRKTRRVVSSSSSGPGQTKAQITK